MSCACGAVIKALGQLKAEGVSCNCKEPGVHGEPSGPSEPLLGPSLEMSHR